MPHMSCNATLVTLEDIKTGSASQKHRTYGPCRVAIAVNCRDPLKKRASRAPDSPCGRRAIGYATRILLIIMVIPSRPGSPINQGVLEARIDRDVQMDLTIEAPRLKWRFAFQQLRSSHRPRNVLPQPNMSRVAMGALMPEHRHLEPWDVDGRLGDLQ